MLELEIQIPQFLIFPPSLSSNIRKNQPFSSFLLAWEKYSKVSYTQTYRSLLFISGWLEVSNRNILCVPIARIQLSVLSLLLEIESLVSLNLIILEIQFQKQQKQFCSFKTSLSIKICIDQCSPEKLCVYMCVSPTRDPEDPEESVDIFSPCLKAWEPRKFTVPS